MIIIVEAASHLIFAIVIGFSELSIACGFRYIKSLLRNE